MSKLLRIQFTLKIQNLYPISEIFTQFYTKKSKCLPKITQKSQNLHSTSHKKFKIFTYFRVKKSKSLPNFTRKSQNCCTILHKKPQNAHPITLELYLTIIPRTRVGYELLDSGRDAEHRVGYHKLISNKRE